jgi:NTE family protein
MRTPDVLVLGGGGILGEAWMSALLAGLGESGRFDARRCGSYVGTSAGSIVAALLASGIEPGSRLGRMPEQPATAEASDPFVPTGSEQASRAVASTAAVATGGMAWLALRASEPAGKLARRLVLGRVPEGRRSLTQLRREIERTGVSWDGRLRISAVALSSGTRVIFDGSGEPEATVAEAVEASCSIPGVFRPVVLHGAHYVDGGAWSPTNMDVAEVKRGTSVLCLNPTGAMQSTATGAFGAIAMVSRTVAGLEAAALRRERASVRVLSPDQASVEAMGGSLMDASNREQVIRAGLAQGRRLARRPSEASVDG